MRAAFIVAPRKFEIRDIPMPEMAEDRIMVKVEACGVCTSDMSGYTDSMSDEMKKRRPFPRRVGHEPSGTVVEVGKRVKGYKAGDRITGFYADGCDVEYVDFDPTDPLPRGHGYLIEKIPDGVPFEYALGEPLMDLVSIARTINPELGDYVFQVGCGFMGLGVIAGVASPKIREYIVCDLDDSRLKLAKELGATITLNSGKVDGAPEADPDTLIEPAWGITDRTPHENCARDRASPYVCPCTIASRGRPLWPHKVVLWNRKSTRLNSSH